MFEKLVHLLRLRPLIFNFRLKLYRGTYSGKVFCTGFNKTGTTSMGSAFRSLGYKNLSYNKQIHELYNKGEFKKVIEIASKFDSFDDIPWNQHKFIPELDQAFPGSKFVHLERDEASWMKSLCKWHSYLGLPVDKDIALKNYRNHNRIVRNYFKDREHIDFLVLDVRDDNDYAKLANFLGRNPTLTKFPHKNKAK